MFLPDPFVFAVAGPAQGDIARLLPEADGVPDGSIWNLDDPDMHMVRAQNYLTTLRGLRGWPAMTPGHTWLGRILVVNHPSAVTIHNAVLLRVDVGDVITLLGAPF